MRARRLKIVDEYVEDGRAAVYTTQGMVLLLSELATAAWSMIGDDWVAATEVAASLEDEFGTPTQGATDDLTEESLRSLADMGLIQLEA